MKSQADKLLNGCIYDIEWNDGSRKGYSRCGEDSIFCDKCEARLSQYLSDCKDNLEFLEEIHRDGAREDYGYFSVKERIDFLKSEISKLEDKGIK
jgi:hypothetical protein